MSRHRRPSRSSCDGDADRCCKDDPATARTLAEIVDHFIEHCRARALAEIVRFAAIKNRRKAIEIATLSTRQDGKVHDRQRRVGKVVLRRAAGLLVADGVRSVKDFDDLIARVTKFCARIDRFGVLTQYDVASHRRAPPDSIPSRCTPTREPSRVREP
jgi:hypothetical protein